MYSTLREKMSFVFNGANVKFDNSESDPSSNDRGTVERTDGMTVGRSDPLVDSAT